MKKIKETTTFKKTKRFLKQIIGEDVWTKPQISCNSLRFGDWCVCPDNLSNASIAYSLGVGEDIEFDAGMIERFGADIHAFDPTPHSIEWLQQSILHGKFHFHAHGISDADEKMKIFPRINKRGKKSKSMYSAVYKGNDSDVVEVQMHKLKTVMEQLGHNKIDILKMDIEGSEYGVIDDLVHTNLKIDQILVEFHHRFESLGKKMTVNAIRKLNEIGYRIFFISELGREYSFLKV